MKQITEGIIGEVKCCGHHFNREVLSSFVYLEIIGKHIEGGLKGSSSKRQLPPNLGR